MERAKHTCIYGSLEFEFGEQIVHCPLNIAFSNLDSGECPYYTQELSRQKDCKYFDSLTPCTTLP